MAVIRDERVDNALQQLVARLLPQDPDEDEVLEDQRWDEAIQLARNLIGRHAPVHLFTFLFSSASRTHSSAIANLLW